MVTVLHVGPFTPRHRTTDWRVVVWDAVSMAELAAASWAAACYLDTGSVLAAVATGVLVADGGVRLRRTSKFADAEPAASAAPGGHPPGCPGHPLASGRGLPADDAPGYQTGAVPAVFPVAAAGRNPRVDTGRSVTHRGVADRSHLDIEREGPGQAASSRYLPLGAWGLSARAVGWTTTWRPSPDNDTGPTASRGATAGGPAD